MISYKYHEPGAWFSEVPHVGFTHPRGTEQGAAWILLWSLWKLSLDSPSPSWAPWAAGDPHNHRGCTISPLWPLTVHVPLGELWIVTCPAHISNSLSDCAFLLSRTPAEDFWLRSFQHRNCSLCSSMDKAVQCPSWVGERILFSALSELLLR